MGKKCRAQVLSIGQGHEGGQCVLIVHIGTDEEPPEASYLYVVESMQGLRSALAQQLWITAKQKKRLRAGVHLPKTNDTPITRVRGDAAYLFAQYLEEVFAETADPAPPPPFEENDDPTICYFAILTTTNDHFAIITVWTGQQQILYVCYSVEAALQLSNKHPQIPEAEWAEVIDQVMDETDPIPFRHDDGNITISGGVAHILTCCVEQHACACADESEDKEMLRLPQTPRARGQA